jgi:hypothetical protein
MMKPAIAGRQAMARASVRSATGLALAAALAACAGAQTVRAQTIDLSGLPPEARLPGMKPKLQASVVGTHLFKCVGTDVVGRYAWYLTRSAGSLFDAANAPIGETEISYSGVPIVRAKAVWRDANGGSIAAAEFRDGGVPGAPDLQWRRFHILSTTGAGPLAGTSYVIRIAAWRVLPYSTPCDKAHVGDETTASFTATDLFIYGVLPAPD